MKEELISFAYCNVNDVPVKHLLFQKAEINQIIIRLYSRMTFTSTILRQRYDIVLHCDAFTPSLDAIASLSILDRSARVKEDQWQATFVSISSRYFEFHVDPAR